MENAVGPLLLNGLPSAAFSISYWRDRCEEVDFIVERASAIWAVEAKSGRGMKATGIGLFRQRYPGSRTLVVGSEGMPLFVL